MLIYRLVSCDRNTLESTGSRTQSILSREDKLHGFNTIIFTPASGLIKNSSYYLYKWVTSVILDTSLHSACADMLTSNFDPNDPQTFKLSSIGHTDVAARVQRHRFCPALHR